MKPSASVVALDSEGAGNVLHCEIIANGTRPITDEVERGRKATAREKVVKEVIQSLLRSCIQQND